jgi:hypothetical protein
MAGCTGCTAVLLQVELAACVGWAWSWWRTRPRVPGRGWTLQDPDAMGLVTLVVATLLYVRYSAHVLMEPQAYADDNMYVPLE